MNTELQASTEQGRKFVALAEEHAADFATRADQHDREGCFPQENIEALQNSGFLAASIPEEFGGMGVPNLHDIAVGMSRLGRGCASTAIAANMHMAGAWEMLRIWRWRAQAPPGQEEALKGLMGGIGGKQIILCAPNTEMGTDLSTPMTEATRDGDSYVVNGHKIFGTLSPIANLFFSSTRIKEGDEYVQSLFFYPKATPGVTVHNNWDAMGMRASGSHDVTLENVRVPASSVLPPRDWGSVDATFADNSASINTSLVCCFLGIAEAARNLAVEMAMRPKGAKGKKLADRIPIQQLIAEIEIDLEGARSIIERTTTKADEFFSTYAPAQGPVEATHDLFKQHQIMKYTVQRNAIDIVDKAMTTAGGSSYMSKSPFSRLYRDVRAGPFMQPFAPYEALEYIGKVTLGVDPQLDR